MHKLGMNVRVTSDSRQGGRKYMEDVVCVEFHKGDTDSDDGKSIDFVYLAVFDGHGGKEAALFAKEHLLTEITKQRTFWSEDDAQILKAIRDGFISTHKMMWSTVELWPKRCNGQPSTAGTTATVVFIRNSRIYVGHVGDSGVLLGVQNDGQSVPNAHCLTQDHKPNSPEERKRIEDNGGQVMSKAGVHRVVWNRPKAMHNGPIRRSTQLDQIPFLAVARSLGDLWSYNSDKNVFVVSPEPDLQVCHLQPGKHKFIVLASDGLWNILKPQQVTRIVHRLDSQPSEVGECASVLVATALECWSSHRLRADNTSAIVVYLDPIDPNRPATADNAASMHSHCKGATDGPTSDSLILGSPCQLYGGRQVASNITNSSERLKMSPAVSRFADCVKEDSVSQVVAGLVSPMWPHCLHASQARRRVSWHSATNTTHENRAKRRRIEYATISAKRIRSMYRTRPRSKRQRHT